MAQPRMIQGQFGSLNYSTGVMDAGINVPSTATLQFNENPGAYMIFVQVLLPWCNPDTV